jgi:hypothetical protein
VQHTPTGCDGHLRTILRTFTNDPKSRSVNNSVKCSDLDPNSRKDLFYPPERRLEDDMEDGAHFEQLEERPWGQILNIQFSGDV